MARLAAILGCWALFFLAYTAAADDRRKYEEGPLTVDDFQGTADPEARLAARTSTELRYDFHYRYSSPNSRVYTVTLEKFEVEAFIRRDLSWNKEPQNERLLDHEQGHADNAQIACLRARLHFADPKTRKELKTTGSSQREAVAALKQKVVEQMREFESQVRTADEQYDRETTNGLGGKQAEWRRVQQETLKRLEEEWEGFSKK